MKLYQQLRRIWYQKFIIPNRLYYVSFFPSHTTQSINRAKNIPSTSEDQSKDV